MMSSAKKARHGLAVFGIGRAGTIHFKNLIINPRARLLYIVDLDTDRAKEMVDTYGLRDSVKVLKPEDNNIVYEDEEVEGIFVCSTTYTHEEIVKNALKYGKAVFCEKPISETVEGVTACYEEADRNGKPLLCSFNRRFDPSIMNVRDRVNAGEIGDIHVVKTCSRDHPLPETKFLAVSGGMYHDCAIHDIDMLCWIIGEYPTTVFSMAHAQRKDIADMNDVDTVSILMKFSSGIIANIDLSRHSSYGYDQRLEILGSKGMLQSQNHVPHGVVGFNDKGVTGSGFKYSFPQRYADSYVGAVNHFLDVLEGGDISVLKEQTLNASKVAAACEESHKTGLQVSLSWN